MKEAALAHPEIVCAAHLGLIRGTLDRLGVGDVGVRVQPMVAEDLCLVDLVPDQAGRDELDTGHLGTGHLDAGHLDAGHLDADHPTARARTVPPPSV